MTCKHHQLYGPLPQRDKTPEEIAARVKDVLEPKLDAPAKVGSTTFGVGVKWRVVIEAAQRAAAEARGA